MGLSEPSETVDDKLAVVAGYLDAYLNDGDSRSLLSPVASRLATHITMMAEADDPGRTTVGRAQVLGPFHWHRYLLMPEGDNRDAELSAAIRYLAALAGADLALVPPGLQLLLSGSGAVGDGPQDWTRQGAVLLTRAESEPGTDALTRSIELFTMALDAPGLPEQDVATALSGLGVAYRMRYERRGDLHDLDAAVEAGRAAVEAARSGGAERVLHQSRVVAALQTRYRHTGDRRDLDEALAATRVAGAEQDEDHPDADISWLNGAAGLYLRFVDYGAAADLDEAIELTRAGERASAMAEPAGSASVPPQAIVAANLSVYLMKRYERGGSVDDLEAGIEASRRAVEHTAGDHPDRASRLSNLSAALLTRSRRPGAAADLDEAVELAERAIEVLIPGDWNNAGCYTNLANALRSRYRRDGNGADLNAAADAARRAVAEATERHGSIDLFRWNLAHILIDRFSLSGTTADLNEACDLLRAGYRSSTAPASLRLAAAASLLVSPLPDTDERVRAGAAAVELLPVAAWFALGRSDREEALAQVRGIGSDAAACTIDVDRPERAAELLEMGRAVLWGQALDLRTDLTQLTVAAPEAAARLDGIRRKLDARQAEPTATK